MKMISFELRKIRDRRLSWILLVCTVVLLPLVVSVLSHLHATDDGVTQELVVPHLAFIINTFSQSFFFLPIWIIIFVGTELSNGHANRVTFIESRKFYVFSKFVYCALVTLLFCGVGTVSFFIAVYTSPYPELTVSMGTYWEFLLQLALATFGYSILLLTLVFLLRSPIVTFVVYFGWTVVEGVVFAVFDKGYGIELSWMPMHLIRTIFSDNGETTLDHYRALSEGLGTLWLPLGFVCILMLFIYRWFSWADMKVLSD